MKFEQRKKSPTYAETVKDRFPNASAKFIKRLVNLQKGKERP